VCRDLFRQLLHRDAAESVHQSAVCRRIPAKADETDKQHRGGTAKGASRCMTADLLHAHQRRPDIVVPFDARHRGWSTFQNPGTNLPDNAATASTRHKRLKTFVFCRIRECGLYRQLDESPVDIPVL
jgi:hypothetical protein